jgi:hypothetical protein
LIRVRAKLGCMLLAAVAGLPCGAQVLYKWTDAEGKVQYSDTAPKKFQGEVTRLEPEPKRPLPAPGDARPVPKPLPAATKAPAPTDSSKVRRDRRESLQAHVDMARKRLDEARKSLDSGREEGEGDRQVHQQRMAAAGTPGTSGGMHGFTSRANCRVVTGADGKKATICSSAVLTEGYHERVAKLEEAVAKAEADLATAEEAYLRGRD